MTGTNDEQDHKGQSHRTSAAEVYRDPRYQMQQNVDHDKKDSLPVIDSSQKGVLRDKSNESKNITISVKFSLKSH